MKTKKTILFDIDGTIRGHTKDGDVIHEPLLPLLFALKQKDYGLGIVTGRPYLFYKEYVAELLAGTGLGENELPFDFVIYENGHRVSMDMVHIPLISDHSSLEMEQCRSIIEDRLQTLGNVWLDENGLQIHVDRPREAFRGETYISIVDLAKEHPQENDPIYGDVKAHLEALLVEHEFDNLSVHTTSISHMTIEAKDSTKKTAVSKLIADFSNVTFCCDGRNDLELAQYIVEQGGTVVCPSNAIDELKNIAAFVATRAHGAGVCGYVEQLLLEA